MSDAKVFALTTFATELPDTTGERMATAAASRYRPYRSKSAPSAEATTWVQIDLGSSRPIEAVKLYPFTKPHAPPGDGFPVRFRIECSDDAAFGVTHLIADHSQSDYPDPADHILQFQADNVAGRYVRLTATRLRSKKHSHLHLCVLSKEVHRTYSDFVEGLYLLILAKIEVLALGSDIALRCAVSVDDTYGNPVDAQQLTRPHRPQGEGLVADNPQNVTAPDQWEPVSYLAQTPRTGVQLQDGLFRTALQHNIRYLLDSFTVDDVLREFRQRAGKAVAPLSRATSMSELWMDDLAGSNAGRFLMGAANSLRWLEHEELRSRLDAVVQGIAECREPNGHIMAFPEDSLFHSERGAYSRAWLTHGLIEAGYSGNAQAFELLRGDFDRYYQTPYGPYALRGCNFGAQGAVAHTRLHFTPVGTPADLQFVQRYLQETYWLDELAARKPDAIWQYPYDRPHCYCITFMEPYLDLYRATGDRRYLEAVRGSWELIKDNWQTLGGGITLREFEETPPRADLLYESISGGETCGSAFWIALNQRLHLFYPEEERYVAEIEKSIYNVLLANQSGSAGIRYLTRIIGQKSAATCSNTCCEGQGTRILGSLAEYIYSVAEDGLYVNLFEPSSIDWGHLSGSLQLQMQTRFPHSPQVRILIRAAQPLQANIRIRTPGWAARAMTIEVNGTPVATGVPGSYTALERVWEQGDVIAFVLPMALRFTPYTGADQVKGRERFALHYGPLLMAALNAGSNELKMEDGSTSVEDLLTCLQPMADQPLHFTSALDWSKTVWVPYFEVGTESFSCVPMMAFGTRFL